jgi:IS5 family transposase
VLQQTISAIRAETWETINRTLLSSARQEKLEDGSVVRLDSTVTAALMHEPSDSSLLWDAVQVMVRLLKKADDFVVASAVPGAIIAVPPRSGGEPLSSSVAGHNGCRSTAS